MRGNPGIAIGITLALVSCGDGTSGPGPTVIPHELTIAQARAALEEGTFTCRALVESYLDRIVAIDDSGFELRSVLEVDPDVLARADELDEAAATGGLVGPLHCAPILLKDNVASTGPLHTTAGSATLEGLTATRDAFIVDRLRTAGAILLGKANMDEWAFSISGYGSRGGQTLNPYDATCSPGGSSGGCAAAVSANLALAAVGTDTAGSLRIPASFDGLVGVRPTLGVTSRSGLVPLSDSLDVPGPLTRGVADAATLLGVLAAADPDDPVTAATVSTDYEAVLDERGLDGSRLGVLTDALGVPTVGGNDEVRSLFQAALADLQESGATVVDDVAVEGSAAAAWGALTSLMCEGFPRGIDAWLASYGADAPVHDLEEIVAASEALGGDRVRELETLHWLLDDCPPDEPEMDQARADQAAVAGALDDVVREAGVEALVFPTVGCPAVPLASGTDGGCDADRLTPTIPLASLAGWPEVTVPAGVTAAGLPIGLSFLGPAGTEATLLRFAYAFEQATHHRREPAASAGVE